MGVENIRALAGSFASSNRFPYQHLREDVGLQIVTCGVQVGSGEFDRRDFRLITGDADIVG
jgi:hypothetical protein